MTFQFWVDSKRTVVKRLQEIAGDDSSISILILRLIPKH